MRCSKPDNELDQRGEARMKNIPKVSRPMLIAKTKKGRIRKKNYFFQQVLVFVHLESVKSDIKECAISKTAYYQWHAFFHLSSRNEYMSTVVDESLFSLSFHLSLLNFFPSHLSCMHQKGSGHGLGRGGGEERGKAETGEGKREIGNWSSSRERDGQAVKRES